MNPASPWIVPQSFRLASSGRTYPALRLDLGGVPRGAVLALSAAGELDVTATAMNRLALHGFESVAVDVSPGHDSARADDEALDDEALDGVRAGLAELALRGWAPEQVGVIGWGSGGVAALTAARQLELGAAVSIGPAWPGDPVEGIGSVARVAETVRTPWLGLFSAADPHASAAALDDLGTALSARAPVFTQLVVYPGVSGRLDQEAAESGTHAAVFDSWQRTVEWLVVRVVPRATPLAEAWRREQATRRPSAA